MFPIRRPRAHDDPFFDAENMRRAASLKQTIDSQGHSIYGLLSPDTHSAKESPSRASSRLIECSEVGCGARFGTTAAFESHYNTSHFHVCAKCKRVFPNAHLLDLHLLETHDMLFQVMLERGTASFACVVEQCNETFVTKDRRQDHLVTVHCYPEDFRVVGRKQFEGKKQETTTSDVTMGETTGSRSSAAPVTNGVPVLSKTQRRRQKEKEKKRMMALVADEEEEENGGSASMETTESTPERRKGKGKERRRKAAECDDSAMDTLADEFAESVRVRVPQSVSFGRGGRGGRMFATK